MLTEMLLLLCLELGRDVLERERPRGEIEEREDAPLELGEDARGGRHGADAVDEVGAGSIHVCLPPPF